MILYKQSPAGGRQPWMGSEKCWIQGSFGGAGLLLANPEIGRMISNIKESTRTIINI